MKWGVLLLASTLNASTGALQGTISDSSGAIVPNAVVSGVQEATGFRFAIESDARGEYRLAVPEGRYSIVARHLGFRTVAQQGVWVNADTATRTDFQLQPGSVFETVTVSDSESQRALDVPEASTVLRPDDLTPLPHNDRTVTGILALAPGVLITPANGGEPGQISSLGGRPNTNRYSVDGVSANNAVSGGGWPSYLPGSRLPAMTALGTTHDLALYDSIEEVRVGAPGRAPGASITIQTRSGTNQFHGSLFYGGRPAALAADDWFANSCPFPHDHPNLVDGGGTAGGPIRRNRTFIFISAERLGLRQVYSWTTTVPSLAWRALAPPTLQMLLAEFPAPNGPPLSSLGITNIPFGIGLLQGTSAHPAGLMAVNGRVDHALTSRTRAFLRIAVTPSWSESGYTQTEESWYRNSVAALGVTRDSGAWTQDVRASFSRTVAESRWLPPGNSAGDFYSQFPSFAADFTSVSVGGAGSVQAGESGRNRQDQIELSQTAVRTWGTHRFYWGVDYLQLRPVRSGPASDWNVAFSSPTETFIGLPAPIWVTYSQIQTTATHLNQVSGFAQDTWHIHPRVSITYGGRVLSALPPHAAEGSHLFVVDPSLAYSPIARGTPLWRNDRVVADPSIAAAWRIADDGNTMLRVSFATFHDGDFAVATDQLNGAPYHSLRSPQGVQVFTTVGLIPVQLGYGFAASLHLPVYRRWGAVLQHSIGEHDAVTLAYSGMSGSGLLRHDTIFFPTGDLGQLSFAINDGASSYHGLSATYRHRITGRLTADVSYSWSHSIDLGSSDSALFLLLPGQSRADRGASDFDIRHNATGTVSWRAPGKWTISTTLYARTGFPIDLLLAETLQGAAIANYHPDLVPGVPLWLPSANAPAGRRLNPAAFAEPSGAVGDLGRNAIRGFGMWQSDAAAERPIRIAEGIQLRIRAETYNLANHPQFGDPLRFLSSPLFGFSGSPLNLMLGSGTPVSGQSPAFQLGGPRSIQLSLHLTF